MQNLVVFDSEVYSNYFLVAFKELATGKVVTIDVRGKEESLSKEDITRLHNIMAKRTTFGFNSRNYDIPVILYALKGKMCQEIFEFSNSMIVSQLRGWQTMQKFGLVQPESFKTFDIQEPSPGVKVSLKLYGARMHSKKLQDLPYKNHLQLSAKEAEHVKLYCINDLDTTVDLYNRIKDRMKLRYDMIPNYGFDILSKSDAQIAEVVIKQELKKLPGGKYLKAPTISKDIKFKCKIPDYIKFKDRELNKILDIINNSEFELDNKGSVKLPKELKNIKIKLGYSTYKLGIGGLHSNEKCQSIIPNDGQLLIDKDVAAYYPNIILNNELYPRHLGPNFLNVYRKIVQDRLAAKKNGDKVVNETLKIVINGSFGKLGNKYSVIYSPDLMTTVTLTGQLTLLMLIERLEDNGISAVSANTDGIVSLMHKDKHELFETICREWEVETNFELEGKTYKALYSRDVNNYIAITEDSYKVKGRYSIDEKTTVPLSKNPEAEIINIAVIKYLTDGTAIKKTIHNCNDVRQFIFARSVTGGAIWKGQYLGRVVRWIWSTNGEPIRRNKLKDKQTIGDKVANSDGARPIMELGEFPSDIDYQKYIDEAMDILDDLGTLNL